MNTTAEHQAELRTVAARLTRLRDRMETAPNWPAYVETAVAELKVRGYANEADCLHAATDRDEALDAMTDAIEELTA